MTRRVAFVTGAGRGIGAAICRRLATECGTIVVVDSDPEPAEAMAVELKGLGVEASAVVVDVRNSSELTTAVDLVASATGKIDVVVGAAGCMAGSPIETMSDELWEEAIQVNLTGSFSLVRATTPWLRRSSSPRIVLVSSVASRGIANHANYGAAKAGIIGLTRSLAWELGPSGILINAVAPGFIDTRMTREGAKKLGVDWADFEEDAAGKTALGRTGSPEEVATVVNFLAASEISYVTGQVINVSATP